MAETRMQRRLAAILAADVAGYSRLMRADESGTLAFMRAGDGPSFPSLGSQDFERAIQRVRMTP